MNTRRSSEGSEVRADGSSPSDRHQSTKDALILKLVRGIAYLMGRGAEYDAECRKIDAMDAAQRDAYVQGQIKQLKDRL